MRAIDHMKLEQDAPESERYGYYGASESMNECDPYPGSVQLTISMNFRESHKIEDEDIKLKTVTFRGHKKIK